MTDRAEEIDLNVNDNLLQDIALMDYSFAMLVR